MGGSKLILLIFSILLSVYNVYSLYKNEKR